MFCDTCMREGRKSSIQSLGKIVHERFPTRKYWDEDGNEHLHDYNPVTENFLCSNNHYWTITSCIYCPTCGILEESYMSSPVLLDERPRGI